MKNYFLIIAFLSTAVSFAASFAAPAKEIALTFDDCPRKTGTLMNGMERAKKLTDELKKANARVAFFCNSPTRQSDGPQRLKYFAEQGHLIANHSATHPDLYKTPVAEYIENIE